MLKSKTNPDLWPQIWLLKAILANILRTTCNLQNFLVLSVFRFKTYCLCFYLLFTMMEFKVAEFKSLLKRLLRAGRCSTVTTVILPGLSGTNQKNFPNSVSVKQQAENMSFVDTLRQWDEAITCANRQEWSEALKIFLSIQEPISKICFNIGCLQLLDQDLDAAEKVRLDDNKRLMFSINCAPLWWKSSGFCWWGWGETCFCKVQVTVKEEVPPFCCFRGSCCFLLFLAGVWLQHTQGWASGGRLLSKRNHLLQKEKASCIQACSLKRCSELIVHLVYDAQQIISSVSPGLKVRGEFGWFPESF